MTHPLVDVDTLAAHLDDPAWVVFDCRHDLMAPAAGEASYRDGHIAGARFAHLDRDLSGAKAVGQGRHPLPAREDVVRFLAASGAGEASTIVAYDASNGLYASRLWWLARWIGHADVVVLDGGLPAWLGAGHALATAVPAVEPGDIALGAPLVTRVATADVVANLDGGPRLVIDARAPERYRGDIEPLDPVAGHIPGAVNRPMAANLAADGRYKDAATLRTEYDALLDGRDPASLIHSCGSGVTACHHVLAMEVAGLPGAAIYPGSWSAWCADPSRPVARGPG